MVAAPDRARPGRAADTNLAGRAADANLAGRAADANLAGRAADTNRAAGKVPPVLVARRAHSHRDPAAEALLGTRLGRKPGTQALRRGWSACTAFRHGLPSGGSK